MAIVLQSEKSVIFQLIFFCNCVSICFQLFYESLIYLFFSTSDLYVQLLSSSLWNSLKIYYPLLLKVDSFLLLHVACLTCRLCLFCSWFYNFHTERKLKKITEKNSDLVGAQEGLDALANLAIQSDAVDLPASSQTKRSMQALN